MIMNLNFRYDKASWKFLSVMYIDDVGTELMNREVMQTKDKTLGKASEIFWNVTVFILFTKETSKSRRFWK